MKISKTEKELLIEGLELVRGDRRHIVHSTNEFLRDNTPQSCDRWNEIYDTNEAAKSDIRKIENLINRFNAESLENPPNDAQGGKTEKVAEIVSNERETANQDSTPISEIEKSFSGDLQESLWRAVVNSVSCEICSQEKKFSCREVSDGKINWTQVHNKRLEAYRQSMKSV